MPHKALPSVAIEEPSADEITAISPVVKKHQLAVPIFLLLMAMAKLHQSQQKSKKMARDPLQMRKKRHYRNRLPPHRPM